MTMARCPFATFEEITGPVGDYLGGPFKIVHHTTEGTTYAGAKAAYSANRSDPHFTVAGSDIFQHIDTDKSARSLRNDPGGAQTNRDSAVQIEVVGFAGRPKDVTTLQSVARLCRWIETTHGVAQTWPNGQPRSSTTGRDPGGHNRDATTWDSQGGHFGHSQVPENTHWDPGYTAAELAIVTPAAVFDPHATLQFDAASLRSLAPETLDAPERPESADVIVQRVMTSISSVLSGGSGMGGSASRVSVRVASGGVEVEVTLETTTTTTSETPAASTPSRTRPARPRRRRK